MGSIVNLIGRKFGKLTVLHLHDKRTPDGKTLWECSCECGSGKLIVTRATSLKHGNRISCGCMAGGTLDITGHRYGYLIAIERTDEKDDAGNIKWRFHCDGCGRDDVILANRLVRRARQQQSCGCMAHIAEEPVGIMGLIKYYKRNGIIRGKTWQLTVDACRKLFFSECHYCGNPPSAVFRYTGTKIAVDLIHAGIDRVDNSVGYIQSNVVSCCSRCNYAKKAESYDDFIDMCRKVAAKHPAT